MKIKVSSSEKVLTVSVTRGKDTYAVDLANPLADGVLAAGLDVLMGMLAGVPKADLYLAVARHFEEASNAKEA